MDTAGQVERFTKRVEVSQELSKEVKKRATARAERERARALVEIVDEEEAVEPIDREEQNKAWLGPHTMIQRGRVLPLCLFVGSTVHPTARNHCIHDRHQGGDS